MLQHAETRTANDFTADIASDITAMGRRALPKIDPALDLSRSLKSWEELPKPWDPLALFGRVAPLEVEIGTGKGLFLQGAAALRPEHNFFGIEIAHQYARFAGSRLARRQLHNACVADADALRVVREVLPAEAAVAVHVYFPDPWWKKKHRKRRVMNEGFLPDIERLIAPGGTLHFWTDVEEYFQTTLELLAQHTKLIGPLEVPEPASTHDLDYRTHFERRMRMHELPVYRSEFRKAASPQ